MSKDTSSLPSGAGTTTRSRSDDTPPRSSGSGTDRSYSSRSFETGTFEQDEYQSGPSTATVVGAAFAGALIGGALPFMFAGRSSGTRARGESAFVEESVTIRRPAKELYAFWRDFTNLPQFMDNIKSVTTLSDKRSHWVIKAPAGTSVEFDSIVTEDTPGRLIAWQSEGGATVPNRGRVEFEEISPEVTLVRATISYDPPAGEAGRLIAKLFRREPGAQARQDLTRFKEVMESR
ncbi:MAG: SRPBCC family protein [Pseudomonadota bacterium]|nr:SRPBCC family protein [Pseudomonadota bacterium]